MSEKFQIGTVVCLRSGGPPMTVEPSTMKTFPVGNVINPPGMVFCVWFNGEALERAQISDLCLEPAILVTNEEDDADRIFAS